MDWSRKVKEVKAFTLVEMLAVMLIIAVVIGIAVPALTVKNSSDLTKSVYDFQGALQYARSYAVSHHTYTWVGFFEEDATKAGATPAVSGIGRINISIVASKDGTPVYNKSTALTSGGSSPAVQVLTSSRLVQLTKLIRLDNVRVFSPDASTDEFGQRPGSRITDQDRVGLGGVSAPLVFQFQYPLTGPVRYTFGARGGAGASGIVQFNPQGEAISETGPVPGVVPCKEIVLQATRGTVPHNNANIAAISIAGLTGQSTIYRR